MKFGGNGATVWSVAAGGAPVAPGPEDICPAGACPGFGIMFYNTEAQDVLFEDPAIPDEFVHDWCQAWWAAGEDPNVFVNPDPTIIPPDDPATPANETTQWFQPRCLGTIHLNGSGAPISLYPLKLPVTSDNDCDLVPVPDSCFNGLVIYQDRTLNRPGDDVILNGNDSDLLVRGTIYVPYGDVRANGDSGSVTVDQVIAWRFTFNGNVGNINVLNNQDFVFQLTSVGLVE